METLFPAKIEFCTSEPLGCDRRLRLDGLAIRPTLVMEQVHEVLNDGSGGTIGRALAGPAETSGAAIASAGRVAEPIAIVGMACRFPGARNPDEFWRLIREGATPTGEIPPSRWDADEFYDPTGEQAGKMSSRWAGSSTDVDQFDPQFFGIAPREAARMDPQQRLLLEVAWEALEGARAGAGTHQRLGHRRVRRHRRHRLLEDPRPVRRLLSADRSPTSAPATR